MSRFYRIMSGMVLLCILCGLLGCNTAAPTNAENGTAQKPSVLPSATKPIVFRIGHQRADPLNLLKLRGDLDRRLAKKGIKVEWVNFTAGPQLLEALGVNSLDFGSVGDSPAIFAQAAGIPLVYIANIPISGAAVDGEAILVPQNSPIKRVADLKGKRIAFQKASGSHNLVIQVIETAGLSYSDIKPVYLSPPDARVAFESGSVDAWAVWDPFLAVAIQKTKGRILANRKGIITPGSFYLASRPFAEQHPEILKLTLEEIDKVAVWASKHPKEAARILSENTGIDAATLEFLQSRRPRGEKFVGIRPINEDIIRAQQTVADNYYRIGLLPVKVDVRKAMLSPEDYARLTPESSAGGKAPVANDVSSAEIAAPVKRGGA